MIFDESRKEYSSRPKKMDGSSMHGSKQSGSKQRNLKQIGSK